ADRRARPQRSSARRTLAWCPPWPASQPALSLLLLTLGGKPPFVGESGTQLYLNEGHLPHSGGVRGIWLTRGRSSSNPSPRPLAELLGLIGRVSPRLPPACASRARPTARRTTSAK